MCVGGWRCGESEHVREWRRGQTMEDAGGRGDDGDG